VPTAGAKTCVNLAVKRSIPQPPGRGCRLPSVAVTRKASSAPTRTFRRA